MSDRQYRAVKEKYQYGEEFDLPRKGVELEVDYRDEYIVVHYLEHDGESVV